MKTNETGVKNIALNKEFKFFDLLRWRASISSNNAFKNMLKQNEEGRVN